MVAYLKKFSLPIGSERDFRSLFGVIVAILLLNLLDTVMTTFWLSAGLAQEANPFMDVLVSLGPVPFAAGKLMLVSAGAFILWRRRRHAIAVIGVFFLFVVYYCIMLMHAEAATIVAFEPQLLDMIAG